MLGNQLRNQGLREFTTGGTHEENPNGGIPMGIGANGKPNLVEQGETMAGNYVFSDRLKPEKSMDLIKYNLPAKYVGMTYAAISKAIGKELKEKPNDPIVKAEANLALENLKKSQEEVKARQQQEKVDKASSLFKTLGFDKQKQQEYLSMFAPENVDIDENSIPNEDGASQGSEEEMLRQHMDQNQMAQQPQQGEQNPNMFADGGDLDETERKIREANARLRGSNSWSKADSTLVRDYITKNFGSPDMVDMDSETLRMVEDRLKMIDDNYGESKLKTLGMQALGIADYPSRLPGKGIDYVGSKITGDKDYELWRSISPSASDFVDSHSTASGALRYGLPFLVNFVTNSRFRPKYYKPDNSDVSNFDRSRAKNPTFMEAVFPHTTWVAKKTFGKKIESEPNMSYDGPIVRGGRFIARQAKRAKNYGLGTLGLLLAAQLDSNPASYTYNLAKYLINRRSKIGKSELDSRVDEIEKMHMDGKISPERRNIELKRALSLFEAPEKFDNMGYINKRRAKLGVTDPNPKPANPNPANPKPTNSKAEGGSLEFLRFAPAVSDGIKTIQNLFGANRPDYSDMDYLARLSSNMPRQQYIAPYERMQYRPADVTTAQNNLLNASNSTLRNIVAMSGNNGALGLAGLLSGANSYYGKMAEMGLSADAANNDRLNKIIEANNNMLINVDRTNSGIFAQNSSIDQYNYKNQAEIMDAKQKLANTSSATISGTRNNFLQDLYDIGHEEWLARHKALQTGYDTNGNRYNRLTGKP